MWIALLDRSLINRFGSKDVNVDISIGTVLINKGLAVLKNINKPKEEEMIKKPMEDKMIKFPTEKKNIEENENCGLIFPKLVVEK
jgi:hypothetical protein